MVIAIGAASCKGDVRETNQDACCVELARTSMGDVVMAVVCDGVGGLDAGEYASSAVVSGFVWWFKHVLPSLIEQAQHSGVMLGAASIRESWGELIAKLNESLHDYAHGSRMGTTLSGVIAMEGRYVVVHVGDTRIYRLSNDGIISQITEDQTRTNKLVAEGDITLEEAELSRDGHVIMQAIGSTKSIVPAFYSGRYRNGDLFVACSDGAWHCVGEEGIQSCFEEANWQSDESLDDACNRLINYDMSLGETDNLTVVCFAINETAPETSFEEFPKLGIMADAESSLGRADLTYVDITAVDVDSCEEGDA